MRSLLQALEHAAAASGPAPLLIGTRRSYSAAEALARLADVEAQLAGSGIRRLLLCADNSPAWALVDIAAQLAGVVLVPLPTWFSGEQFEWVLQATGADAICCESERLAGLLPTAIEPSPLVDDLVLAYRGASVLPALPEGTAKITFTSGSTGRPKGVCLSTRQCLRVAHALLARSQMWGSRHLALLPMATLLENLAGLYVPLLAGGSVLLPEPRRLGLSGSSGLDAPRLLQALAQWQPNSAILVPELLRVLVLAAEGGWQPPPSLRFLAVGGARVAPPLVQRARTLGLPVYEGYGLSECASVVSLNAPGEDHPGTSGKLLEHVTARVVDGELRVAGNPFLGYLGEPGSWYPDEVATGDLVQLSQDGVVTVAGRRKNLLVTAFGRNVSPEWVESELLAGGELMQAVVLGEGRPFCVALLYPLDPGASDTRLQRAVNAANARLPDYARIVHWRRLARPLDGPSGLLTGNGRPRRDAISRHYRELVESMYPQQEARAL